MRLTALCICGTLLAFTSLSWTTVDSDEGDLLEYDGFGPCAATLRAEGPCRHGQDETTCPYLFSMPPLTVYLPKQLSELEKIVEDLQKLKDNVDQLRRMCADCTVSQTERECGRQSEREHEKLNEKGTERRKDERNSLNERNPERLKEFRQECGTDRLKPGKSMKGDGDTDSGKRTTLEEKGRKRWETERESNKGVVKENEDEETRKAIAESDGKTQREGAKGKDELGQAKVPTAGGNERIVDIVREKVVERNNKERETDRNKEKGGRGISKGDQEDMLESGKERRITTNIKNKEKKEESDRHVWRDKTKEAERNTQTEEDGGSDGIKMSVDRGEHTNKEQEQNREERKKEMERGIKVDRNNEKPKQTESIGRAEKEKTIKEGAVEEEEEREIKTEVGKTVQSVQRDSDGELSSSKPIERTDFVSIRPTPHFTMTVAPRHDFKDSNEAEAFTSSLPSPPPPPASSSTSRLLTGVDQEMTITAGGLTTQSKGLGAAGNSEHPRSNAETGVRTTSRPAITATVGTLGGPVQQITRAASRVTSTTSARPGAGLQGRVSSTMATATTTTPHQNLYTTTFPGVAGRSRWTAKKNISSNTKTGVKPLPGRGPKPGENHKPAIKPEVDRRLKKPKNDRKPGQAPLPDKKTKHDQKQRPSHQKPTTDQRSNPDKGPKRDQIPKPDQRPPTDNLPTDQSRNNIQTPNLDQEDTTDQNQLLVQRPTSHQRPETLNRTGSDKGPRTDQDPETPSNNQNSKKPLHPLKTDKLDQEQKPHKKTKSEEKTNPDQRSTINQYVPSAQEPEPERTKTASFTPKPDQNPVREVFENPGENPSPEPKSVQHVPPGQKLKPDRTQIKPSEQKPKPNQTPKTEGKQKPDQKTTINQYVPSYHESDPERGETASFKPKPDQNPATEFEETSEINPTTEPKSVQDLSPGQKLTPDRTQIKHSDQKPKPNRKPKAEGKQKTDQRSTINQYAPSVQEPDPETSDTVSLTPKTDRKPVTELLENPDESPSSEPKSVQDSSSGKKLTPDRTLINPSNQRPKPNQIPSTEFEENSEINPTMTEPKSVQDSSSGKKLTPDRTLTKPSDQKPKPNQTPKTEGKQKPDQKTTINQYVPSYHESDPERGETASFKPKPDQNPATEFEETSEINPTTEPKSVQDLSPGQKLTPDRTQIKHSDQKPKPNRKPKAEGKQKTDQRSTINQYAPSVQEPDPETSDTVSLTPKTDRKPVTELLENPDESPSSEPKSVQDSSSAKKLTPDRTLIKPSDQKPKTHIKPKTGEKQKPDERSTINQYVPSYQEPKPERTETASFTPKPKQNPGTESLESPDTNPSPEPNSVQEPLPGQKLTPDRTQKPKPDRTQKPKPDQKSKLNQYVPSVQEPDPEISETVSLKPKPNQNPATEFEENSYINPSPDPNSVQDSSSGIKLTPDRTLIKPSDQLPKPKQNPKTEGKQKPDERSSINQYVPSYQGPGSEKGETASFTPKPKQNPETESFESSDPSPEPNSVQEPSPGQKLTPDHTLIKPSDQKPKPHIKPKTGEKQKPDQKSKLNQYVPSVQEPDPERSETARVTPKPKQNPGTELLESSEILTSPEPVQDSSSGQKRPHDPNLIKPSDQKPKNPKTEEKQKPDQRSTVKQTVPSVQEPDPERSETARVTAKPEQNPGTELLESSEILTSPEPNSVQEPSPGQKRPHDPNLIKPSDQKPKNPKTEEKQKPDQRSTVKQSVPSVQEPDPERSETAHLKPKPDQNPGREFVENSDRNASTEPNSVQDSSPREKPKPDRALIKPKPSQKTPKIHQKPKPGQPPKLNQKHPDPTKGQKTKPHVKPKPNQRPQTNQEFKTPQPDEMPDLNPKSVPDEIPGAESNKTSKPRPPTRSRVKPGATSFQRPKPSVQLKPSPETKTDLDPPQITRTTTDSIQNSQTDMPPASGHKKQTADVTHSPGETEFSPSRMKTITLGPKTSNSLETGPFPRLHAPPEGFTMSPNSRITSDLRPQTVGQPPSIPMTTRPNKFMHGILPSVIPSTSPGSTKPSEASDSVSRIQPKILHNMEETAPRQTPDPDKMLIAVPSPSAKTTSTTSPDFGSTSPATSGPEPLAPEASTPSARELRVKINQVAAFFNNSLSPNGRLTDRQPIESPEDNEGGSRPDRTDSKRPTLPSKGTSLRRDCSDYLLRGDTKSGVYLVTPDLRSRSFSVFCDMELDGGGWTLLQRRQDGSVSFNRTWDEYRSGFGELDGGEFWLGNNMIHVLTRDRDMMLRVELEDFDGVMEYAEYEQFKVASERWRYRLSVDGYSGTAGDALRFSKSYDHNNRAFTTPDRDHDRYPSGNCGAYYSSGWWFDACMAANLNGKYYVGKYKGVRDGIFWGTWRNISTEYYPTNDRQSFKTVRMMIRPNGFRP
ncbi:uncharacterized protein AB9X84_012737 [Acanthopagrus schlegelii]